MKIEAATRRKSKSSLVRQIEGAAHAFLFCLAIIITFLTPYKWIRSLLKKILPLVIHKNSKKYKLILKNLEIAFPNLSSEERNSIAEKNIIHFAEVITESLYIPKTINSSLKINYVGVEHIQKFGLEKVIFSASHLGSVFMYPVAIYKFGVKNIDVLSNFPKNPAVRWAFKKIYERFLNRFVWKDEKSGFQMNRSLASGNKLLIFNDQKQINGIQLPFFDAPALFGTSTVRLAYIHGCPIIPMKTVRTGELSYSVEFHTPIFIIKELPKDEAEKYITMRINKIYEEWIKENPEQYIWDVKRYSNDIYE